MQKNKFTTYLLYAIGEIFLVVIGILIAVSINNWNQRQKQKGLELERLISLRQDIEMIVKDVQHDIELHNISLDAAVLISDFLSGKAHVSDSLIMAFELAYYDFRLDNVAATYNSLKNNGLDIISNEELRAQIVYFYDTKVPFLQRVELEGRLFHQLLLPIYQKNLQVNQKPSAYELPEDGGIRSRYGHAVPGFIPIDSAALQGNQEFSVVIREVIYERTQVMKAYMDARQFIEAQLLPLLTSEIDRLIKRH